MLFSNYNVVIGIFFFFFSVGQPPIIRRSTHFSKFFLFCLKYWSNIIATDRPNSELQYPIGANFCLEESEEYYFSISCSLQYHVNPAPRFQFYLTQNSTQLDENYTVNVISETSHVLTVNRSFLLSESIEIICSVSNIHGNDSVMTSVRICGKIWSASL